MTVLIGLAPALLEFFISFEGEFLVFLDFLLPVFEIGDDVDIFNEYFWWDSAVVDAVVAVGLVY